MPLLKIKSIFCKPTADTDRVAGFLGPFAELLDPLKGFLFCVGLFLIALPLLPKPLELAFCCWSIYLVMMAATIERKWFSLTSLPPLFVVVLAGSVRWGFGGALILAGGEYPAASFYKVFSEHLYQAQLLWAIFSTALVFVFALAHKSQIKYANNIFKRLSNTNYQLVSQVALVAGVFTLLYVLTGVFSGTLDRSGVINSYWVAKVWRADSLFVMFLRLKDVFFFIAPLAISSTNNTRLRVGIIVVLIASIGAAFLTGGRGIILYPLLYFIFGLWLTPLKPHLMRIFILIFLFVSLTLVPAISLYRSSAGFARSSRFDIPQRVQLISESIVNYGSADLKSRIQDTGGALYACSDPYLFVDPALSAPRAGLVRINRLWQTWLPTMVAPNKASLRDAHMIAAEITGTPRIQSENQKYTSFMCVSYVGDLYWRGGWLWVVSGSLIFSLFYRFISQFWYKLAGMSGLWNLFALVFPATFLIVYPAGSLGETFWLWLWDFPKYVMLIALIGFTGLGWNYFRNSTNHSA